ncbi:hypothetical protein HAX54_024267, partial [Datura stramonium]|nr:hypothetical protein [Datura stramonium]
TTTTAGLSLRRWDRSSGSICAQRKWRDRMDEVLLGLAVTQRQLLHSSADEVVSFIC